MVLCAQVVRDRPRVLGLVVVRLVEADAERADGSRRSLLHQRDHKRGVDPAREEGSHRHVGHHPGADGCAEGDVELLEELILYRAFYAADGGQLPVWNRGREYLRTMRVDLEKTTWGQFGHAFVDRQGARHVGQPQVSGERGQVDSRLKARVRRERLEL